MGCEIIAAYSIETQNLTKKFYLHNGLFNLIKKSLQKDEFTSLEDINLKIRGGEVFGIIGPNGAGKTTLIKILCTLITPSLGAAYVNDYDVVNESKNVRESIGLVTTDERSFYWRLTGRQNLKFFASLHNIYSAKADERVSDLLDIVRLRDKADSLFMSYSAGMKQRMAIARGLLNDPIVLFMDEPTRSLDPGAAQNLRDFINEYIVKESGKTIFLSTHNLNEAEQLCNRIAVFDEGKIVVTGSPEELKKSLEKNTLCDVFTHYTGKSIEDQGIAGGLRPEPRGFRRRGGFGMRRKGI